MEIGFPYGFYRVFCRVSLHKLLSTGERLAISSALNPEQPETLTCDPKREYHVGVRRVFLGFSVGFSAGFYLQELFCACERLAVCLPLEAVSLSASLRLLALLLHLQNRQGQKLGYVFRVSE